MLQQEFFDALHRAGVDWPWLMTSNMHAIAEAIYGSATDPVTGSDLVPGGLPGHDAVAKLVKKNLGMFKAIAQLREADLAERTSRNLELSEAKAQKILDDREIDHLRGALLDTQRGVAKQVADNDQLRQTLFETSSNLGRVIQENRRLEAMLDVYQQLYGDAILDVVKAAATGRRLTSDLSGRCENERPRVDELQALVV